MLLGLHSTIASNTISAEWRLHATRLAISLEFADGPLLKWPKLFSSGRI